MRIHWDEQAKRLAEKHDLYTHEPSQIEVLLEQDNGIIEFGIETDEGKKIYWYLKDNWIYCKIM